MFSGRHGMLFLFFIALCMRFLFYMGHPAHYHNVKFLIPRMLEEGHEVKVVARGKDVLFDLLGKESWDVVKLPPREQKGKMGLVREVWKRERKMWGIAKRFKPDVLIGTDIVITHIASLLGKKSYILNEDDASQVPLLARFGFKYASGVFSPNCCNIKPYNRKKIGYEGYHELAYLHPHYFTPDENKVHELVNNKPYFMLRFSALDAHHDDNRGGISNDLAVKLIKLLEPFGSVYITSERPLNKQLEPHRIQIDPSLIHHALAFASLLVSDSQTMTAEAAVLGTPSVRYNDFVGKLGYLEELEHKYALTFGIRPVSPEELLSKVKEITEIKDRKVWEERRACMLQDKIDVTEFWFNYLTRR